MPAIPMAVIELLAKIGIQLIGWWSKSQEEKERRNKEFMAFLGKMNPQIYDSIKMKDDFKDLMEKIKEEEHAKSNAEKPNK